MLNGGGQACCCVYQHDILGILQLNENSVDIRHGHNTYTFKCANNLMKEYVQKRTKNHNMANMDSSYQLLTMRL